MPKRKRSSSSYQNKKYKKPRYISGKGGPTYKTVARTRGPYAMGEMKYFDTYLANTAFAAGTTDWTAAELDPATFLTLCVPTQGNAINQRVGRQVYVHSIKLSYVIYFLSQATQNTGDAGSTVRLLIVQDKQTNSSQMQGEDVMQTTGATDAPITNCAFMNVNNFGRFKILKDKLINMAVPTMTGSPTAGDVIVNGFSRQGKIKIKFRKPVIIHFNSTNGGTIADIIDNSFHVIGHCTSSALTPRISYNCRVGFKEEG